MNKKLLFAILSVLVVIAVVVTYLVVTLVGVPKKPENNNPKNNSSVSAVSQWKDTTITTDNAKIANEDAINYIKSYSAKELSLSEEDMKKCDFMFSGTGYKIKDDYYVRVNAIIKHEKGKDENGNALLTFDNKGEYYIRYDGKQVLKKDMSAKEDKYTELKVKKLPEKTTVADKEETATEKETTTKK